MIRPTNCYNWKGAFRCVPNRKQSPHTPRRSGNKHVCSNLMRGASVVIPSQHVAREHDKVRSPVCWAMTTDPQLQTPNHPNYFQTPFTSFPWTTFMVTSVFL